MGDLKHRALAGIVMVAVIAAVIERSILGTRSMFEVPSHPESHALSTLAWSLVLGLIAGALFHLFVGVLLAMRERAKTIRGRYAWMLPGLGGLATGCIGAGIFVNTDRMGVFGIGYEDLSAALVGELGLALLIGKFVATIVSYSSGGVGGVFAPTLFIGAMLGGILGSIADATGSGGGSMPGTLALAGMGAMFAGIIRALVTSILIIFELTGDYNLILPIMAANLSAYAISSRLRQVPIYEALLLQDGISLKKFPILRLHNGWQNLPINAIMTNTVHTLEARLPLEHAYLRIKDERFKIYPVVDTHGKYVGMVHRKGITVVSQKDPDKLVQEIFTAQEFPKVYPDMKIREVAKRFVTTEWSALPVVSRLDEGRVVGVVTLHDITRQQFLQERES